MTPRDPGPGPRVGKKWYVPDCVTSNFPVPGQGDIIIYYQLVSNGLFQSSSPGLTSIRQSLSSQAAFRCTVSCRVNTFRTDFWCIVWGLAGHREPSHVVLLSFVVPHSFQKENPANLDVHIAPPEGWLTMCAARAARSPNSNLVPTQRCSTFNYGGSFCSQGVTHSGAFIFRNVWGQGLRFWCVLEFIKCSCAIPINVCNQATGFNFNSRIPRALWMPSDGPNFEGGVPLGPIARDPARPPSPGEGVPG